MCGGGLASGAASHLGDETGHLPLLLGAPPLLAPHLLLEADAVLLEAVRQLPLELLALALGVAGEALAVALGVLG